MRDRPNATDIGRVEGTVAFENVSFSYDGKRPAVADLSFVAKPGDTIALVGSTGSGKSTTLSLLHRVFDPQSGRVLIDGHDIRDILLVSLRRNIGVVFQEPMLFARTIRENLQVGRPEATEEEIWQACARAQATEFLKRQPDGLDTEVAERGRSLSGGERQRLSIARALLKDPPILILDEATSALDATTEQKLQLALEEVMKGRTTFVIAHRLATIRHATRILVFDQGRVIEAGTFEELVAQGGTFANLAKASSWPAPRMRRRRSRWWRPEGGFSPTVLHNASASFEARLSGSHLRMRMVVACKAAGPTARHLIARHHLPHPEVRAPAMRQHRRRRASKDALGRCSAPHCRRDSPDTPPVMPGHDSEPTGPAAQGRGRGPHPKVRLIGFTARPSTSVDQVSPAATGNARVTVPVVMISPAAMALASGSAASTPARCRTAESGPSSTLAATPSMRSPLR